MTNVTYLLGAGASANCLPVINNFTERLEIAKNIIKDLTQTGNEETLPSSPIVNKDVKERIIEDFNWVIQSAASHQTIDTLAKKFFHTDHKNLIRLKRILILFFQIEQLLSNIILIYLEEKQTLLKETIKETFDKRYDSFIASILKNNFKEITLVDNVKVLSWNYDSQFEIALQKYTNKSLQETKQNHQIFPNRTSITNSDYDFNMDKFGFIKLNGSAEYDSNLISNDDINLLELNTEDHFVILQKLFEYYEKSIQLEEKENSHITCFNYSWEITGEFQNKYLGHNGNINKAFEIAKKTDILVIIGYSFPFFNREIDRQIMNSNSIRKVYVQDLDPESRIFTLKDSFVNLRNTNIQPINFTNSFFLPPEL
jgi:hypothetical protein